jgi:hypothetical protein
VVAKIYTNTTPAVLIKTTDPTPANGALQLKQDALGIILHTQYTYKIGLILSGLCGGADWTSTESPLVNFTMPGCATSTPNILQVNSGSSDNNKFSFVLFETTGFPVGVTVAQTPVPADTPFTPNTGTYIMRNIPGSLVCLTGCYLYPFTYQYTVEIPEQLVNSSTWAFYVWYEGGAGCNGLTAFGTFGVV